MVAMLLLKTVLVLGIAQTGIGDREHKVHNIVLYPERHSWCQTTAIKQIVASPGYEPTTIDNNVCVGACFSYSIPRTQPAEPGELIGPYCDSCQPAETKCYHVVLHADDKNNDGPRTIKKRVEIIMNCSCISCEKVQNKDCELTDQNTAELPMDLFNILHPNFTGEVAHRQEDVPDLIHLPQRNRSVFNVNEMNFTNEEHNEKLIKLLRSMEEEEGDTNISYDKKLIRELLEILEKNREELSNVDLMRFLSVVNLHNSENLQVDLSKLKEFLHIFKKNKHKSSNLDLFQMGAENNEEINRDLDDLTKKYDLPNSYGLEGHRGGMTYQKGSHIASGLDDNTISTHHHYIGEEQHVGSETGHLIPGPHGSLVLTPDVIKPNQEGLVLSYENHPKNPKIILDED